MPSKGEKYYFVASLSKGLRTLELLAANREMTASRVATHLGTSRAASHRFLSTLRDLGYVEKTAGGRFRLTFKVVELGMKKLEGFEIRRTAHPFMQEIAFDGVRLLFPSQPKGCQRVLGSIGGSSTVRHNQLAFTRVHRQNRDERKQEQTTPGTTSA